MSSLYFGLTIAADPYNLQIPILTKFRGRMQMSSHHHHHHHHDESHSELPFEEKLAKILDHWIKHNEDHAQNYKKWAQEAKTKGLTEAGELLLEAADISLGINQKLEKALTLF